MTSTTSPSPQTNMRTLGWMVGGWLVVGWWLVGNWLMVGWWMVVSTTGLIIRPKIASNELILGEPGY
jgi:hypothetical protein